MKLKHKLKLKHPEHIFQQSAWNDSELSPSIKVDFDLSSKQFNQLLLLQERNQGMLPSAMAKNY